MKIIFMDHYYDEDCCDFRNKEIIAEFNGESHQLSQHILYDCPEDAIWYRDLNSPDNYLPFIKMAYEAGKRGEELEIIYTNDGSKEDE